MMVGLRIDRQGCSARHDEMHNSVVLVWLGSVTARREAILTHCGRLLI